jgi:hypothetical protein
VLLGQLLKGPLEFRAGAQSYRRPCIHSTQHPQVSTLHVNHMTVASTCQEVEQCVASLQGVARVTTSPGGIVQLTHTPTGVTQVCQRRTLHAQHGQLVRAIAVS